MTHCSIKKFRPIIALVMILFSEVARPETVNLSETTAQEPSRQKQTPKPLIISETVVVRADADDLQSAGLPIKTPVLELPMSVETVDSEMITDLGIVTFTDIFQYVSGVSFSEAPFVNTASGSTIQMRGFGGTESSINGLYIPGEMHMYLDSQNIERVESYKGSDIAVLGSSSGTTTSGSVGGGMNIVTKQPKNEQFINSELQLRTGGNERYRLQFDANLPIMEDGVMGLRFNGAEEASRPFYLPSDIDINSNLFFSAAYSWKPIKKIKINLDGFYQSSDKASYYGVPVIRGEVVTDYDQYYGFENSRTKSEGAYGQVRAEYEINKTSRVSAGVSWLKSIIDADVFGLSFGASSRNPSGVLYTPSSTAALQFYEDVYNLRISPFSHIMSFMDKKRVSSNLQYSGEQTFGDVKNSLVAGVDHYKTTSQTKTSMWTSTAWYSIDDPELSASEVGTGTTSSGAKSVSWRAGCFIHDQLTYDDLRLMGSVRYDKYDSGDYNDWSVSWKVGASYLLTPGAVLYSTYNVSAGPNLGKIDESGNEIKDDWKAYMKEAGIKLGFGKDFVMTIAGFHIYQNNIATASSTVPGAYELTGSEKRWGQEIGLGGRITENWFMHGSYTWQKCEDPDNDAAIFGNIPEHSLSIWTNYRFSSGLFADLKLGIGYIFVDERDVTYRGLALDDSYALPSYNVVNLSAEYPIKKYDMFIRLNIDNLFDEEYITAVRHLQGSLGEPSRAMISVGGKL